MTNNLKEDSNKHMNEIKRSIQDVNEKFNNLDENSEKKVLKMKSLINQIKNSMGSITNRLDQIEERI
jgi:methyl-accepting chemotaxis protein